MGGCFVVLETFLVPVPPINLKTLQTLHHQAMRLNVGYKLGAKVSMKTPISKIKAVDCSAWVRYLVFHSTTPNLLIPDGSWHQKEWAKKHLKQVDYRQVMTDPSKLYLAALDPKGGAAGHVWFCNDLYTLESRGGMGPDERPWNTPFLLREVDYCFVFPHIWA
jgi:hypothetical protein